MSTSPASTLSSADISWRGRARRAWAGGAHAPLRDHGAGERRTDRLRVPVASRRRQDLRHIRGGSERRPLIEQRRREDSENVARGRRRLRGSRAILSARGGGGRAEPKRSSPQDDGGTAGDPVGKRGAGGSPPPFSREEAEGRDTVRFSIPPCEIASSPATSWRWRTCRALARHADRGRRDAARRGRQDRRCRASGRRREDPRAEPGAERTCHASRPRSRPFSTCRSAPRRGRRRRRGSRSMPSRSGRSRSRRRRRRAAPIGCSAPRPRPRRWASSRPN